MGNKWSSEGQTTKVLERRDLAAVAKYMTSDKCRNVMIMLGAGVSTSAGIPDFRSPETGLYANLARLNLPYPEAVFEINYFRQNPVPFYMLAHELYPGRFRPTPTHSFIRLLSTHSLLHTCFTQNIDTLERRAGVPEGKIIEAHGSFASQRCINCRVSYDDVKMRQKIKDRQIAKCDACGGLVKPDIVFFGESLPPAFSRAATRLGEADLLIIMGTSLTVHPFASLVNLVPSDCPRVLINLDPVGTIGSRTDDVVLLGKCDDIVRELCVLLGWEDELLKAWEETKESVEEEEGVSDGDDGRHVKGEAANQGEEGLKGEMEKLTSDLERVLALRAEAVATQASSQSTEGLSGDDTADKSPELQTKSDHDVEPPSISSDMKKGEEKGKEEIPDLPEGQGHITGGVEEAETPGKL